MGREIVVLDNLSLGRRENVRWGTFVEGDIADAVLVRQLLQDHKVSSVIHLAASAHVGESMQRPDLYFANNTVASKSLLDAMLHVGVKQFVFASSCSVYGNTINDTVKEHEAVVPVSPYGESKLAVERMLPWYASAFAMDWIALRYFNAAGAQDDLGEDTAISKRIIPRALHATLHADQALCIYGTAFPTKDGSAIRDYVHVADVARANLLALQWLEAGNSGATFNIGAGKGTSVLEIIRAVEKETGKSVARATKSAREGDPGHVIADVSKARDVLGWEPRNSQIDTLVSSLARSCELSLTSMA